MHQSPSNTDVTPGDMCPLMGFAEERYIPGHPDRGINSTGWAPFYTCICNGKRVFVWAYDRNSRNGRSDLCCVMVWDSFDPGRGAEVAEIQHMFAHQHERQKRRNIQRTHHVPADPFLLQAFIHEVTRGGNEAQMWREKNVR